MIYRLTTRLKPWNCELVALALILCALGVRLALIALGWPDTDSDEGTMGLEALHILARGEHPIYLYGQNYMGVGEAYLGALMYRLFGVSLVSLRLGMLALFAGFLVGLYVLASLLYSRRVALVSLGLLVLGARVVMLPELRAVGGAAETLVCGTGVFVLAVWLALNGHSTAPAPARWRLAAYAGWGLLTGLGLWSHLLIVPFVAGSALLLLLFCCRELRRAGVVLALLAGLVIGAAPMLIYNLTAPAGQNSLAVFWQIHQIHYPGAPSGALLLAKELAGTLLYSIPLATGPDQVCRLETLPLYGPPDAGTLSCVLIQGGWSVGLLALLLATTILTLRALRRAWATNRRPTGADDSCALTRERIIQSARVLLLAAGWLTLAAYTFSESAAIKPWSTRYLVGLLILTPALLWPLLLGIRAAWTGLFDVASQAIFPRGWAALRRWLMLALCGGLLLTIFATWGYGTIRNFAAAPAVRADSQVQARFIDDLLSRHVTHVYSGYWVCDRLIFQSHERLICGVLYANLEPGLNRYVPYYATVAADPHAAYAFPIGSDFAAAFARRAAQSPGAYQQIELDGYVVYMPRA